MAINRDSWQDSRVVPALTAASTTGKASLLVSVVVPVYNEADGLSAFLADLLAVIDREGWSCEVICVDDGSTDRSLDILVETSRTDRRLKVLSLSRNFGKDAAMLAGLRAARGKAIVQIDADTQHPPAAIPALVAAWQAGHEIVYGIRMEGAASSWSRRLAGALFHGLYNRLSATKLQRGDSDFRLMSRRAVKALLRCTRGTSFVRGLSVWIGMAAARVPYREQARGAGRSKWTGPALMGMALSALLQSGPLPMHIAALFGAGSGFVAIATAALLWLRAHSEWMFSVILATVGMQLLLLALLSEYLVLASEHARRPRYIVGARYGFEQVAFRPGSIALAAADQEGPAKPGPRSVTTARAGGRCPS